jgi:hypothetical protein
MSTYTLTSKYCQDCERTISTVHIILAITVVIPLIPESSYTVTYGNNITLDCIITSIPELQNVSWKMETNGILYNIDTTNTFKYQGSTVEHTSLSPIRRGFAPGFVNYKKGALDSQSQVIKFTSCLPIVGGSLRVLRLLPSLKLVAMI